MDYTILYVILVVCATIGIAFGVKYLKNKNMIDSESLLFVISVFNLGTDIVDELNLKKEIQIKVIANIVLLSLDYCSKITDESADKKQIAIDYAKNLCSTTGIELTEARIKIIEQLVNLGLNK